MARRRRTADQAEKDPEAAPTAPYRQSSIQKHLGVGALALVPTYMFWLSRPEWDSEMRLWRSFGDSAFVLLTLALAVGPLAVLWRRTRTLVTWRRALGIWFALMTLVHAYLVWDGWARWSVRGLLGYQDLRPMGIDWPVLVDPGFGLANLIGLVALFWALVLLATSSDWAMRLLGGRTWKYVHLHANMIYYLVALHVVYFMFLHYDYSLRNLVFRTGVPDPNWFRFLFLIMVASVFALQLAAFFKTLRSRKGARQRGGLQE